VVSADVLVHVGSFFAPRQNVASGFPRSWPHGFREASFRFFLIGKPLFSAKIQYSVRRRVLHRRFERRVFMMATCMPKTKQSTVATTNRGTVVTVAQLLTRHRRWGKDQPDGDASKYRQATRALFALYGNLDANRINATTWEECRRSLSSDGLCDPQIDHYLDVTVEVWRWGLRHRLVDPAAVRRLERLTRST